MLFLIVKVIDIMARLLPRKTVYKLEIKMGEKMMKKRNGDKGLGEIN